jgi:hypothetical protein
MDISKAYDLIGSIMMEQALRRIKTPEKLINTIKYVFENRHNRVIAGRRMIQLYEDGLDQGEVQSPRVT